MKRRREGRRWPGDPSTVKKVKENAESDEEILAEGSQEEEEEEGESQAFGSQLDGYPSNEPQSPYLGGSQEMVISSLESPETSFGSQSSVYPGDDSQPLSLSGTQELVFPEREISIVDGLIARATQRFDGWLQEYMSQIGSVSDSGAGGSIDQGEMNSILQETDGFEFVPITLAPSSQDWITQTPSASQDYTAQTSPEKDIEVEETPVLDAAPQFEPVPEKETVAEDLVEEEPDEDALYIDQAAGEIATDVLDELLNEVVGEISLEDPSYSADASPYPQLLRWLILDSGEFTAERDKTRLAVEGYLKEVIPHLLRQPEMTEKW